MEQQSWKLVLESLRNDMEQIGSMLKEIAQQVIEEEISEFPVFVATQQPVDIGRPIPEIDHLALNWFFYVTILEDFVKRGIVQREKLYEFQRTFGNPLHKACICVVTDSGEARLVFIPYPFEED